MIGQQRQRDRQVSVPGDLLHLAGLGIRKKCTSSRLAVYASERTAARIRANPTAEPLCPPAASALCESPNEKTDRPMASSPAEGKRNRS